MLYLPDDDFQRIASKDLLRLVRSVQDILAYILVEELRHKRYEQGNFFSAMKSCFEPSLVFQFADNDEIQDVDAIKLKSKQSGAGKVWREKLCDGNLIDVSYAEKTTHHKGPGEVLCRHWLTGFVQSVQDDDLLTITVPQIG